MCEQILKFIKVFEWSLPYHVFVPPTLLFWLHIFALFGSFQVVADVKEVLDTFRVAAEIGSDSFGAYVISMASNV